MTSTFCLTYPNLAWTPQRLVYDDVVEAIAEYTKDVNPKISDLFAHSGSEYTGGMVFINDWTNPQDFQIVLDAVIKYRQEAADDAVRRRLEEDYFECVDELISMLKQKIQELKK
ncbi:MAG: hypothetical protein LBL62_12335 [Planctomycetaceae bacterium]|jgi:hypothetical protein|nr:hypothetical protein [Planctomycetaceae bacterium]